MQSRIQRAQTSRGFMRSAFQRAVKLRAADGEPLPRPAKLLARIVAQYSGGQFCHFALMLPQFAAYSGLHAK